MMFTPKPRRSHGHPETLISEEEVQLFQKHLEEGYDIQDERYDLWKHMYHPADTHTASSPGVVTTSSADRSPIRTLSPARLSFQEEKEEGEKSPTALKGMRKVLARRRRVLQSSCNKQQLCQNFCHIQSLS